MGNSAKSHSSTEIRARVAPGIFVWESKNSGGHGCRGTLATLTKSLDLHDYHKWTLGVQTPGSPPAAALGYVLKLKRIIWTVKKGN